MPGVLSRDSRDVIQLASGHAGECRAFIIRLFCTERHSSGADEFGGSTDAETVRPHHGIDSAAFTFAPIQRVVGTSRSDSFLCSSWPSPPVITENGVFSASRTLPGRITFCEALATGQPRGLISKQTA